jgi:hypothetical protein
MSASKGEAAMGEKLARKHAVGFVVVLALGGCAGNHASLSGSAKPDSLWELNSWSKDDVTLCMLSRRDKTKPVRLSHVRFPHAKDAGILDFEFVEPSLNEAAKQRTSVVLEFDTGPLDGYMLRDFENGFIGVRMTTYVLSNVFSAFDGASWVKVKTSGASAVIDLTGLSEALPSLRECAAP